MDPLASSSFSAPESFFSPTRRNTNSFQTMVNTVNSITGYGLLTMPFALSQGGWVGLAALLLIATISVYTALLLLRCMDSNPLAQSYPDIGQLAFGYKGRILMTLMLNFELYFMVIGLLLVGGDNMDKVFPGVRLHVKDLSLNGKQTFALISTVLILPTTWLTDLRLLSYLSMGSILLPLLLISLLLWIGAFQGVGFSRRGEAVHLSRMPSALSIFAFSYGGHTILPTVYASTKDPSKFSKVVVIGFAICSLQYGLMAVVGYLMYGAETESMVTLNLPQQLVSSQIATWLVISLPFVKYALAILPVINSVEELLQIKRRTSSILMRTFLVISTAVIAVSAPFFVYVVAFTGSIISNAATIILPCLCYLKIFRSSLKCGPKVFAIGSIIAVGVCIAVSGTCVTIKEIIDN